LKSKSKRRRKSNIRKHEQLLCIEPTNNGKTLWLERVDLVDGACMHRFVWRGTRKSKNSFNPRPAHFNWAWLGELIGNALRQGHIGDQDKNEFLNALKPYVSAHGIEASSCQHVADRDTGA
jgi:hypothetical protein